MSIITIRIDESLNAQAHRTENLIHSIEFATATRWINQLIHRAGDIKMEGSDYDIDPQEAITLLGTRGSGKTTFLLSLLKTYRERREVEVLKIIDPTLMEEKGHIFLDVISRIQERVDEVLIGTSTDLDNQGYLRRKEWDRLLKRLAHGLPHLDGLGGQMTEPSWQDSEFIMNNGLLGVKAARKLREHFQQLLDFALDVLNKKVFLITFDDIDIDFRKGWTVLETVRKYFSSRNIITILSGDMRLYSKAIRKQQWKNFGKALLKNESEQQNKLHQYNELVTTMEGQYMQKVMRPDRRIHLSTLAEKISSRTGMLEIYVDSNLIGQAMEIQQFYHRIFQRYGIFNNYQAEPFVAYMLSRPIRTQIQFMASNTQNVEGQRSAHMADAFLSDLYEREVDVELLFSNPRFINLVVLKFLLKNGELTDFYQLQPTSTDSVLNGCVSVFSMLFSQASKTNSYMIFDNLIKIGYIRNLSTALNFDEGTFSAVNPSIEGLCRHAGIFQDGVLRDMMGNMTAYMRAVLNIERTNNASWGGTIPLAGFAETAKQGAGFGRDRIDKVFSDALMVHKAIAYFPLSVAKPASRNNTVINYSVYGLLATIGDLLKTDTDSLMPFLELSQIRTYNMPEFNRGIKSSNEVSGINEVEVEEHSNQYSSGMRELQGLMRRWSKYYIENTPSIAPYLLGKISTRFFFALDNIDIRGDKDNLGNMFSARIIALLNAVLIEEVKENGIDEISINLNNTNSSPKVFLNNLKGRAIADRRKELPLSAWILSCPLLLAYVDPELLPPITAFCGNEELDQLSEINIYEKLCQVSPSVVVRRRNEYGDERGPQGHLNVLINTLSVNKVPFDLFVIEKNGNSRKKNEEIRGRYSGLFEEEQLDGDYLRGLRKYIADHNIKW